MNRLEAAAEYMKQCAALGSLNLKQMNPQCDGLPFVISYLYSHRDETVYPGDIAKASGVSTARVAAALNKLEKKQLIVRLPSEKDSRKTVVRLTDEGIAAFESRINEAAVFTADVMEIVGAGDMYEFLRLARKIKGAIETLETKGNNNV